MSGSACPVVHWTDKLGKEVPGYEQVGSKWAPHTAAGFVYCGLDSPKSTAALPEAVMRTFGVSISDSDVLWYAPHDERELQSLPGLHRIVRVRRDF